MAKRTGYISDQKTKRSKVDDFNDLWDDDFDGDVIDDCFERATQICEETSNTTLLTSYSAFKQPCDLITSTQITQQSISVVSLNLEQKLKQLQDKYTEKEGEVKILRANLQNLRTTCHTEQERKEAEWKDKFTSIQKESKAAKSELEFKNLEIANLKHEIAELNKHINSELNSTQRPKTVECTVGSPQKPIQNVTNLCGKVYINSQTYYPLRHFSFLSIFKPSAEEHYTIKTNTHRTHNAQKQTDFLINFKKKVVMVNEKELDLNYVYPEITFLINLSLEDINSEKSKPALKKLICVSQQLLTDFYEYLKEIEENIQLQDIQEFDSSYLQENNKKHETFNISWDANEIGIKCGKLLGFLAELVPFSSYLRNFLLNDGLLNLDYSLDYVKLLPCLVNKTQTRDAYLTLIMNTILIIGRTRREQKCSEFLNAVIKLLSKIFSVNEHNSQMNQVIYNITKEILFLRPHFNVIYRITFFLKIASQNKNFIECLCSKPDGNKPKNTTKGILYFNRESCRFHVFVILLENALPKINNGRLLLCISLNILNFIYNIFKFNNSWLYQLEEKRCSCLCQLYKLGIGIIYRNLKSYQELSSENIQEYKTIFKNGIKVLHLLTSNSYDLIQKYVTDLARFKEIVYSLIHLNKNMELDEEDLKTLEKLSVIEDFPEIPSIKFTEVDF